MPQVLNQYGIVVDRLSPILENLPGKVIAIDGKNGSGKTTLGRYLAWTFNVSLIETDLFHLPSKNGLRHDDAQIKRLIEYRLEHPRPVIVEGVTIQQLLGRMSVSPDFIVYVRNNAYDRDDGLVEVLERYEARYRPEETADLVIDLDVI